MRVRSKTFRCAGRILAASWYTRRKKYTKKLPYHFSQRDVVGQFFVDLFGDVIICGNIGEARIPDSFLDSL